MWEIKTVSVNSIRTEPSPSRISYAVRIYPSALNCSKVATNRQMCMSVPGCMYCISNAIIRVLQEVDENSLLQRSLYPNVLPLQISGDDQPAEQGLCMDGWSSDDCVNLYYNSAVSRAGFGLLLVAVVVSSVVVLGIFGLSDT